MEQLIVMENTNKMLSEEYTSNWENYSLQQYPANFALRSYELINVLWHTENIHGT